MAATLDGRVASSGAVFEAKFMLPWSFSEEAAAEKYAATSTQYVGGCGTGRSAFHYYRWRKMGRDQGPCRSTLSAPHRYGGTKVLALRRERRAPRPFWNRTTEAADRGDPYRRCGAELAAIFSRTRPAHIEHEQTKAELKRLMPDDARQAIGHGIRAKRSKSGAISFDLLTVEGSHVAI